MDKKVVQDIIPSNKRSIRQIPPRRIPAREKEPEGEEIPIRRIPPSSSISRSQARFSSDKAPRQPLRAPVQGKRRFPGILATFLVVFLGVAVIAVALSLLYSKAAVTITPKTQNIEINGTFTAKKSGESAVLAYETITAAESMSQVVPATDGPLIETKAKGTATLYNEQTTQQKIVAGTRLSNTDGEVYRTTATVTIPAGRDGAPGKTNVGIVADQAGAQYNMSSSDPGDLKVVAYKGTPKYATVYAKTASSLTGGFSGQRKIVSPEVQKAAVASLKESLRTKLVESARALVPQESILFDGAFVITYETPEPVSKGADSAEIIVKGTLHGAAFKKTALLKHVAAKDLDKFPAPAYRTEKIEDVKFTLVNTKDFSPQKGSPLIFTLKGPVKLVGTFSEIGLKNDLKGTYLKDSNTIFARYPSIASAYALITPFWMRSFPNSVDNIVLEIKN